jgi:hypothetical protein
VAKHVPRLRSTQRIKTNKSQFYHLPGNICHERHRQRLRVSYSTEIMPPWSRYLCLCLSNAYYLPLPCCLIYSSRVIAMLLLARSPMQLFRRTRTEQSRLTRMIYRGAAARSGCPFVQVPRVSPLGRPDTRPLRKFVSSRSLRS